MLKLMLKSIIKYAHNKQPQDVPLFPNGSARAPFGCHGYLLMQTSLL